MRHRKKLLCATILLGAAYATLCFWPHSHPEAVRALAATRGMIEIDEGGEGGEGGEAPQAAEAKSLENVQIELRVHFVAINMTDATAGLFAAPGRIAGKTVVGRTRSDVQLLKMVHSTDVTNVCCMPVMTTLSGHRSTARVVGSVPMISQPSAAEANVPAVLGYRNVGTTISCKPRCTSTGSIILDLDCELSHIGRSRTVATSQGPVEIPEVHALSAKTRAEVRVGETLVIGGLAQKSEQPTTFELPGLSELPGIGSWFCFSRQREVDMEVLILATPRIVTPLAAK